MNVLNVDSNLHKFPYKWKLKDYPAKNGLKVFSTFACGGGSTMGYKLAGYDVIGANDIDPRMAKVYKKNHNPKHYYLCDIRELNKKIERKDVDKDLYNLDILDGSPPCSSFSMAGRREKDWGKEKKFTEGQAKQTLDDLFFDFIETTRLLQPKVVVAENVKGMLQGNAKGYVVEIMKLFDLAGYEMQIFLLNAASMGVPQRRERVFFVGHRKDLGYPKLKLDFHERVISLKVALDGVSQNAIEHLTSQQNHYWNLCKDGDRFSKYHPKGSFFGQQKVDRNKPCTTLNTKMDAKFHWKYKRYLTNEEWAIIGTFPIDYNYLDVQPKYLIGMSVPPVMMAQVASQIYEQWLQDGKN